MDQYPLESHFSASIGLLTLSDHAPVSIFLHPSSDTKSWTWRLNENILDDAVALKQVSDLSPYFAENSTYDRGLASIWEGHKSVIRGELISQGSRLKKAHKEELQTLVPKNCSAKLRHKRKTTPELAEELGSLCSDLANLLDARIWARLRYVSHKFYEYGYKCGKLLARALRRQRALAHIHKIHTASGSPVIYPSKIAVVFRDYYAQLYYLPSTFSGKTTDQKAERIQ